MSDFKLIFERSRDGHEAYSLPAIDVDALELTSLIPCEFLSGDEPNLPSVAEVEFVRHYTGLARRAFGVDNGFYPLGSCTMKYNPKRNEALCSLDGFKNLHPLVPNDAAKGPLTLMWELKSALEELTGMDDMSLSPAAGAHGELTGLMLIRAYHISRGDIERRKILVPDSAHGTNPASAAALGLDVIEVPSDADGMVDTAKLRELVGDDTCALMLTCPNTLGLFERNILDLSDIVHKAGGLMYYDGANLNAMMGVCRPGDIGFDVVHLNLHKTMSTPHGGGGPGSGPVGVKAFLSEFLPAPQLKEGPKLEYNCPKSIGQVKAFYGNFAVLVRAYCYIRTLGPDGLKAASEYAVLSANYLLAKLKDYYELPYPGPCMHEFVLSAHNIGSEDAHLGATDVAKALIDRGFHPPTVHFPLIIKDALMIEPTETENIETLDEFAQAMVEIAQFATADPQVLRSAPLTTPIGRPDDVLAARKPKIKF